MSVGPGRVAFKLKSGEINVYQDQKHLANSRYASASSRRSSDWALARRWLQAGGPPEASGGPAKASGGPPIWCRHRARRSSGGLRRSFGGAPEASGGASEDLRSPPEDPRRPPEASGFGAGTKTRSGARHQKTAFCAAVALCLQNKR